MTAIVGGAPALPRNDSRKLRSVDNRASTESDDAIAALLGELARSRIAVSENRVLSDSIEYSVQAGNRATHLSENTAVNDATIGH